MFTEPAFGVTPLFWPKAHTLGVTKSINARDMVLVTLRCDSDVHRASLWPDQFCPIKFVFNIFISLFIIIDNKTNKTNKRKWCSSFKIQQQVLDSSYGECATCHCTNCHQAHFLKMFNLYVSFLFHSSIKIVSQKKVILVNLSQKLVSGFFQWPVFMMDANVCLSATLTHSRSLFLCLSCCLPVSLLSVCV
jgi:hypothetical protein